MQSYNAKLSDFGLAKDGLTGANSHVSTRVMGTHGYVAPEYLATGISLTNLHLCWNCLPAVYFRCHVNLLKVVIYSHVRIHHFHASFLIYLVY